MFKIGKEFHLTHVVGDLRKVDSWYDEIFAPTRYLHGPMKVAGRTASLIAIGDLILLTRGVAIEGTAILAREKSERLRGRVDADLLARAARFLIEPGISVVSAALAAANVGAVVHAMHDPTEGGLAMGLFELVGPAGLGLRVIREHIPVFPETDTICGALALDPLKLIASGALLIAVAPDRADSVLTAIEATGVPVVVIGEVRPSSEGIIIVTNGA